jgi:hypothetical protein
MKRAFLGSIFGLIGCVFSVACSDQLVQASVDEGINLELMTLAQMNDYFNSQPLQTLAKKRDEYKQKIKNAKSSDEKKELQKVYNALYNHITSRLLYD